MCDGMHRCRGRKLTEAVVFHIGRCVRYVVRHTPRLQDERGFRGLAAHDVLFRMGQGVAVRPDSHEHDHYVPQQRDCFVLSSGAMRPDLRREM